MQVINNELNAFVDCDNTLLMWDNPTVPGKGKLEIEYAGEKVYLTPHTYHVQIVRTYLERGYTVFIWSANGTKHAERVAKALKLEHPNRLYVMTKPMKHLDDNPNPASILGPRVYEPDLTKPVEVSLPVVFGWIESDNGKREYLK